MIAKELGKQLKGKQIELSLKQRVQNDYIITRKTHLQDLIQGNIHEQMAKSNLKKQQKLLGDPNFIKEDSKESKLAELKKY